MTFLLIVYVLSAIISAVAVIHEWAKLNPKGDRVIYLRDVIAFLFVTLFPILNTITLCYFYDRFSTLPEIKLFDDRKKDK